VKAVNMLEKLCDHPRVITNQEWSDLGLEGWKADYHHQMRQSSSFPVAAAAAVRRWDIPLPTKNSEWN